MKYDIWFTHYEGQLYVAATAPGESPTNTKRAASVATVYKRFKEKGKTVATVGIVPPEYLGLE